MKEIKKEDQRREFVSLWHKLLKFDENINVEQLYPNMVQLSVNEISVIDIVEKNPEVILKDIIDILQLPKSTMTHIINRLEKKGYLNRTIAKKDLRSYGLELTEKGHIAQKEHIEYEAYVLDKIMDALNEEERDQLIHIMGKIAKVR